MTPLGNWVKYNTDNASKGNPGPSSTSFCLRDSQGQFMMAKDFKLHYSINLVAELGQSEKDYCTIRRKGRIILLLNLTQ